MTEFVPSVSNCTKFYTFDGKLRDHGFKVQGFNECVYYHPHFRRNKFDLCTKIVCQAQRGKAKSPQP